MDFTKEGATEEKKDKPTTIKLKEAFIHAC